MEKEGISELERNLRSFRTISL